MWRKGTLSFVVALCVYSLQNLTFSCVVQVLDRILRVDHAAKYRKPKEKKEVDEDGNEIEKDDDDSQYDERRRRIWDYEMYDLWDKQHGRGKYKPKQTGEHLFFCCFSLFLVLFGVFLGLVCVFCCLAVFCACVYRALTCVCVQTSKKQRKQLVVPRRAPMSCGKSA